MNLLRNKAIIKINKMKTQLIKVGFLFKYYACTFKRYRMMKVFILFFLGCWFSSHSQHTNKTDLISTILKNKNVINDSKLDKCDTIEAIYKPDIHNKDFNKEYIIEDKLFQVKLYANEFDAGIHNVQTRFDFKDKLYYCKKIFIIVTPLNKKEIKVGVFNPYTGSYITIHYKSKKKKYVQTEYFAGAI